LFSVLSDNGLEIPADQFTEITGGVASLDRAAWESLCDSFGPLIDVLFFRLASRVHVRQGETAVVGLRDRLKQLEDEEHRLLIRHATLREEIARVTRDLRDEEERVKRAASDAERRHGDWNMVQRFVALRVRQMKLKREEEQISKELMLL
jgi:hypothetical protein